jgi:Fe-S oxidoreductase
MSITYNPDDLLYTDADDVSREIGRVFDICHGCRVCFNLCPSFTDLFNSIDAHDGRAGELASGERDKVVEECYQCKVCALRCPYVPPHEWELDFPKLMLRAAIQKRASSPLSTKMRLADSVMSRTDISGRVATAFSDLINPAMKARGSLLRKVAEGVSGIASQRMLPPYAKRRFSTWFRRDHVVDQGDRVVDQTATGHPGGEKVGDLNGSVALFPTCFVEYMDPEIGKDLVGVLEHAGISCTLPAGTQCCGAPWLHSGHIEQFRKAAAKNIEALKESAVKGIPTIVPQATCAYVMRKDYPELVDSPDAKIVADSVRDPMEYLTGLRKNAKDMFDSIFPRISPDTISQHDLNVIYHVSCHTQAQGVGLKARDLFTALGFNVKLVNKCAGIDGTWGYKSKNYALAKKVAQPMKRAIDDAESREVCGDCHLANYAILEETGLSSVHPIQILARAYGIRPH